MTRPRISWHLPPEDPEERSSPSLWRLHKIVALVLTLAVVGTPSLPNLLDAGASFHRRLAITPRRRRLQITYPIRGLS